MKFESNYFIHYYDAGKNGFAHPAAIMRFFEDIAILQSESLNIGIDYYKTNKVAWLLYKWEIDFINYPKFKNSIKIITEPKGFFKFYAFREFSVYNENDELLIKGRSMWFYMNTELRKPVKIYEEVISKYNILPEDQIKLSIADPEAIREVNYSKEFYVRQSDIDTNDHVNNIKYFEWALETIPQNIHENYLLKNLKIIYKKETHYGVKIKAETDLIENLNQIKCCHRILENGNEICMLETNWEKFN